ncbi:cytochrome c-type biogenesis protein [Teredinibacter haidensis]|uniref:cytochrome c-type biogenesis protein n=1 Tax=Teredinibacter haidensis TaxID=2731755 RepID=UPI000B30F961
MAKISFSAARLTCISTALLFGLVSLAAVSSQVAIDAYEFDSEPQRGRYQVLVQELRCPKCQNQNLSDSNSAIAIDLRNEVARMIRAGQTESEIKDYMVNRYGDFVLYRPPVQKNTLVLWWAPVIMLGVGVLVFATILVRRRRAGCDTDDNEEAEAPAGDTLENEKDNTSS